ncbi:MAG: Tol-Pal system beta propeller repeat protein TolB [Candidatus Aminicenantales bacterium]
MKIKFYPAFFAALMILTAPAFAQQEVVLTIKEGMPTIPLALPNFITHSESKTATRAAETLREVISNDLRYSRVFQIIPDSFYSYINPLNPKKILFKDWESIQASILFVGEVSEKGKDNISFEGKLYDVKSERYIHGKGFEGQASLLRLIGHKMANEVMKIYGEKPIFTSKIVFISNRDGNDELYMMDYDGHNQTRLTFSKHQDYMPAWSADGKKIAFTSYRENNSILYLLDLYAQKISIISSKGTNFAPSFSPDGKKIAFCSTMDGNAEIYVANSNGKRIKRLTFNSAIDTAPTWSPTSREIAFTSNRGGTPQIYIMDAEGSNLRRVSFGGNYHDAPAWSPTGDRIVYVSRIDNIFDLYVIDLRTKQITKLTESNARNESPSWSPDGRHIVFSSNLSGSIQLYSIDYDGTNFRRLTSQGENKLPEWSH